MTGTRAQQKIEMNAIIQEINSKLSVVFTKTEEIEIKIMDMERAIAECLDMKADLHSVMADNIVFKK